MTPPHSYDLKDFTPYLLNMAAEASSLAFQKHYKDRYGMLRTEWRALFHLGRYGDMTATEICDRARLHKTKVSRAVAALEQKRFLTRRQNHSDRRQEVLVLTTEGKNAFDYLYQVAYRFDVQMMSDFSPEESAILRKCLERIAGIGHINA